MILSTLSLPRISELGGTDADPKVRMGYNKTD